MSSPTRPDPATLEESLRAQGATPQDIDDVFTQVYGPPTATKWPKVQTPAQIAGLTPAPNARPEKPTVSQIALGGGGGAESTAEYNPRRRVTHGEQLTGIPAQLNTLAEMGISTVKNPLETATGILTALPKAALNVGRYLGQPIAKAIEPEDYAAQQRATGMLAPVTGKEAAESAFQLGASALAGPAETALSQTALGPLAAKALTHGTVGATFTPEAPLAGFALGAGAAPVSTKFGAQLKPNAVEAARAQRLAGGTGLPWDIDLRNTPTARRTPEVQSYLDAQKAQAAQAIADQRSAASMAEQGINPSPAPPSERAYPNGVLVSKEAARPISIEEPNFPRRRPGGAAELPPPSPLQAAVAPEKDVFWKLAAPEKESAVKTLLAKLSEAAAASAEASQKETAPPTTEQFPEGYSAAPPSTTTRRVGGAAELPPVKPDAFSQLAATHAERMSGLDDLMSKLDAAVVKGKEVAPAATEQFPEGYSAAAESKLKRRPGAAQALPAPEPSVENTLNKLFRAAGAKPEATPAQLEQVVQAAKEFQRLRQERTPSETPAEPRPAATGTSPAEPIPAIGEPVSVGRDLNAPGRIPRGLKRNPSVASVGENPNGVMVGPDGGISYGALDPKVFTKDVASAEGTAPAKLGAAKHPPQRPGVFIPDEVHGIRDEKGAVRRDFGRVPNAVLDAESLRLKEHLANFQNDEQRLWHEGYIKGNMEGASVEDFDNMPGAEDAAGLWMSEDDLRDFKQERKSYRRQEMIRQAETKFLSRVDAELERRTKLNYRVEGPATVGEGGEMGMFGGEGEPQTPTQEELDVAPTMEERLTAGGEPEPPVDLLQREAPLDMLQREGMNAPAEPARTPKEVPTEELANNLQKFGLQTPSEEGKLLEDLQRLESQGFTKEAQSVKDQIDAARPRIAKELEYMTANYDPQMAARLTGAEMMALSEKLNTNIAMRVQLDKELATPGLTEEQRGPIMTMIDKLQQDADAMVKNISRAGSQHGRDLAYSRQVAARSLDPAVWLVQAKRALGDAPLTDDIRVSIERLVNEAREACGE